MTYTTRTEAPDVRPAAAQVPEYMTTEEVAELLRTTPATVRYWRHMQTGPAGRKIGKRVLYRRHDVDEWIEAGATAPTAG